MFTFVDLFCGIGGFHVAMHRLGGTCVFACDIDASCRQVYRDNFHIEPHPDITTLDPKKDIPDHDVLCAGFPCQAFSNAGLKKSMGDSRGRLFDYVMNVVREKNPPVILLENVRHIKTVDQGRVMKHVMDSLTGAGYNVTIVDVSPHSLGIPQLRPRVFFVCSKAPIDVAKSIPMMNKQSTCVLEDKEQTKAYRLPKDTIAALGAWNDIMPTIADFTGGGPCFPIYLEYFHMSPTDIAILPQWKKAIVEKNVRMYHHDAKAWDAWLSKHKDALSKKKTFQRLEWQVGSMKADGSESIWNHYIQLRPSGIRVKKSNYFPTLVAMVQVPIYGPQQRTLTPRECARLQSFPDTFLLHTHPHTSYKQLGNSVNVDCVVYALLKGLSKSNRNTSHTVDSRGS